MLFLEPGISWMFGFKFGGLYSQLADTECEFSGTRHELSLTSAVSPVFDGN